MHFRRSSNIIVGKDMCLKAWKHIRMHRITMSIIKVSVYQMLFHERGAL